MNKDWLEKDFYSILGVAKDTNADAIKKKYRSLARELHPDKNPGNAAAEERFKAVSEAYDVLSDADKRKEYDEARTLFAGGGMRSSPFGSSGGAQYTSGADYSNMFGGSGAGFGDLLGDIFQQRARGGRQAPRGPKKGSDLESELSIGFDAALTGVTVPLRLASDAPCASCRGTGARAGTAPRTCPTCEGAGQVARNAGGFAFAEPCSSCGGRGVVVEDPCPSCRGTGRGTSARTVQARIPAGVKDNARIRLKGKGAPGERGGVSGDLYVVVHVESHPVFGRSGDNLTVTVPVSFAEAALGAAIVVPTTTGTVTLKVPAGTASGRTFRVRGKGVPTKDGAGDLMVTVNVIVPAEMSDEARAALEVYASLSDNVDPRKDLLAAAKAGE